MGESHMHPLQSDFEKERNTQVPKCRAGCGQVATDTICLGRWGLDLRIYFMLHFGLEHFMLRVFSLPLGEGILLTHCHTSSLRNFCLARVGVGCSLGMFGFWAVLLFCSRPPMT